MSQRVSAASVAVFRIGFGVVGLILVIRFFAHGWIDTLLVEPEFHFKYPGFTWVGPLPSPWMHLVFVLLGVAAIAIAIGFRHRVAAVVFALGLAYVELIDRTNFLNHYYWLVLTAALMAFLPMSRMWAVDASRESTGWVPIWVVWLLRFQVGMVYFFAGLAKLNPDWLFRAEPLATWLPARSEMWLIGPVLTIPATAFIMSWLGAIFDLTVVGWLIWRRTRLPAFVALVGFHTLTWLLFPSIGVFPLVMSLSALVFFDPDWPQRQRRIRSILEPGTSRIRPSWVGLAAVYVLLMIAIPLRHFAIPGDVRLTAEGYHGSWHVMLTEKTGRVEFHVTDAAGGQWTVASPNYLTDQQEHVMATDPALIQQTARAIAEDLGVTVRAEALISFNGRRSTLVIDEEVVATP